MTTTDSGKPPFYGMYKGIVVNDVDPEGLFRLTAQVPQVFGDPGVASEWAWPCFPWLLQANLVITGAQDTVAFVVSGGNFTLSTPATSGPSGALDGVITGTEMTGQLTSLSRVVPPPGTGVWISFEGGDVDAPIWHGTWT